MRRLNKRDQGDPTNEAGQQYPETQKINSDLNPPKKIDNKKEHMKIIQHAIEIATSSHIQGEMICL